MAFINALLSYLVLFLISAAVAGGGVALGIYCRKRKDKQS